MEVLRTAERAAEEVEEIEEQAAIRAAVEVPAIRVSVGPITELVPQYEGALKIVRSGVER